MGIVITVLANSQIEEFIPLCIEMCEIIGK